jgi:hypothetical protein
MQAVPHARKHTCCFVTFVALVLVAALCTCSAALHSSSWRGCGHTRAAAGGSAVGSRCCALPALACCCCCPILSSLACLLLGALDGCLALAWRVACRPLVPRVVLLLVAAGRVCCVCCLLLLLLLDLLLRCRSSWLNDLHGSRHPGSA